MGGGDSIGVGNKAHEFLHSFHRMLGGSPQGRSNHFNLADRLSGRSSSELLAATSESENQRFLKGFFCAELQSHDIFLYNFCMKNEKI